MVKHARIYAIFCCQCHVAVAMQSRKETKLLITNSIRQEAFNTFGPASCESRNLHRNYRPFYDLKIFYFNLSADWQTFHTRIFVCECKCKRMYRSYSNTVWCLPVCVDQKWPIVVRSRRQATDMPNKSWRYQQMTFLSVITTACPPVRSPALGYHEAVVESLRFGPTKWSTVNKTVPSAELALTEKGLDWKYADDAQSVHCRVRHRDVVMALLFSGSKHTQLVVGCVGSDER